MENKDNDEAKAYEVDNYAQRKNYAKGLVDISLLTSNAHQLAKQYLEAGGFNFNCFLLSLSIILQVNFGFFSLFLGEKTISNCQISYA